MKKYKIVYVKDEFINLVTRYPNIIKKVLVEEKCIFDSKQLNLIFERSEQYLKYFKDNLFLRDDYMYFHGIHKLENEITEESITFIINQYDIEVIENNNYIILQTFLCLIFN